MNNGPRCDMPLAQSVIAEAEELGAQRRNGELVFEQPWEARAFALAAATLNSKHISAGSFREYLGTEIMEWEKDGHNGEELPYYRLWLRAFERLAVSNDLVDRAEVEQRFAELIEAAEHDHDHRDHAHHHSDGHKVHGDVIGADHP